MKPSNIKNVLTSDAFSITDSHYGTTAAIYRCERCGFLQCTDLPDVLPFYEDLVDPSYDAGRSERSIQARKILEVAHKLQPGGRLLDIGAGSGVLVEQAIQMGYQAEGVEPSGWLRQIALQRNVPLHLGTFPHPAMSGKFDVITLIDVIEHVCDPIDLLHNITAHLARGGTASPTTRRARRRSSA